MWWPFGRKQERADARAKTPLFFHNTLTGEKDEFTLPSVAKTVRIYNCGPTLYGAQHIGNLSMFVFVDSLRRLLEYNGFAVKQVINFTDFGHLSSDADEGEDKMALGLKREGLAPSIENMRTLAEKYAAIFLSDLKTLGVAVEKITFPYASDYIPAQIAIIRTLEEKGYAYRTEDGVYFDTARFPAYGRLGNVALSGLEAGARVASRKGKRHSSDFVLWKSNPNMGWESPWGKGFPGWHIECSAMARALLGERIDIHTGGIEHIPIHHNNEIAQSEAATGKRPFSRFWIHRAHIQIEGGKIAKSVGNVIYLADIEEKAHPKALRYLYLGAHYRTPLNFSWEALEAAQTAYLRLRAFVDSEKETGTPPPSYMQRIRERLNDDLDTPGAIAIIWEMIKDDALKRADIRAGIFSADQVLGLGLDERDDRAAELSAKLFGEEVQISDLPDNVSDLIVRRTGARKAKNWQEADALRDELSILGYSLDDGPSGTRIYRRASDSK